jgi:hypothetical protein
MTTTPDIPDALLDTLGSDSTEPLVALYRRIDERLAAISCDTHSRDTKHAAELARNAARGILRAEFHNAGIDLN